LRLLVRFAAVADGLLKRRGLQGPLGSAGSLTADCPAILPSSRREVFGAIDPPFAELVHFCHSGTPNQPRAGVLFVRRFITRNLQHCSASPLKVAADAADVTDIDSGKPGGSRSTGDAVFASVGFVSEGRCVQ
jgi:hypothetical protein